ncbi:MAG TPA: hypothetical protein VEG60_14365, partial [Candidatus Binatia bacterium]|nr:hypothetical protein [Candidatus Binatia bacterium]
MGLPLPRLDRFTDLVVTTGELESRLRPDHSPRPDPNSQVYRAAADGLTIGATSPGVLSSAVLGAPGAEYDPFKFIYLGSPFSENNNMFVTRKAL